MINIKKELIRLIYFLSVFFLFLHTNGAAQSDKTRLIVLADIGHDPDDEQQIVHMLMCSHQFDLEGLIAVTGRFFRPDPPDSVKVLMPELFHFIIDAYEEVYPNLLKHADGWKTPAYLHKIVASGQAGNGMIDVGLGRSSEGSKLLTEAVLKEDDRPVYVISNGGMNTLAQALYDYRSTHTEEELDAFVSKLRVYDNSGQDECGAWICHEFPDIFWIRGTNQNRCFGGPSNNNLGPSCWYPYPYNPVGQHQWMKENVQTHHGKLGEVYPDRKVAGTFHFVGGGGTIPWMGLVAKGLSDISQPSWGGWSGRYSAKKIKNVPSGFSIIEADEKKYFPYAAYADAPEIVDQWADPNDGKVYNDVYTPVWRWRQAIWNDLKARMDWCLETFENANHHPVAILNGDTSTKIVKIKTNYNETIQIDAKGSYDPDNDQLKYHWWVYPEAGKKPYGKPIPIMNDNKISASLQVPRDAATRELHVILEVTDNNPIVPLVSYRRLVIIVTNY